MWLNLDPCEVVRNSATHVRIIEAALMNFHSSPKVTEAAQTAYPEVIFTVGTVHASRLLTV